MYFVVLIFFLLICPIASIAVEFARSGHVHSLIFLIGKWLTFWAVGVRLLVAGVRQIIQPRFTAKEIFQTLDTSSLPIVREVGFANLSMGILATWSIFHPDWIAPAAIVGGLYYGFAGLGHLPQHNKNAKELTAMISDLLVSGVLFMCLLSHGM
jgi:uncharacterized protein YjeT (DUF2065 family)